jgi:hypothetical protein
MVNNNQHRILFPEECKIKKTTRGGEIIKNGPVYDLDLAKELLRKHNFIVVNEAARENKKLEFNPEMSDAELVAFILALNGNHFDTSERCKTSKGKIVDCDAYAMKWNRTRQKEWEYASKIYVKFGFAVSDELMLILCIHPSAW